MELVERLEKVTAKPAGPGGIVRAKKRDLIEAAARIREMVEKIAMLEDEIEVANLYTTPGAEDE